MANNPPVRLSLAAPHCQCSVGTQGAHRAKWMVANYSLTDWMFCKHAEAAGGGVSVSERKKNQTKCRLASTRGNYNVMNRLLSGSRTTGALTG